jgi:alpha-D-ribose 1-methylphosphonate 5-triphosphate synthase subunit PhnG
LDEETNPLAFNQSIVGKADIKKELDAQTNALNDALKQNTTLNDELKVKSKLIKVLREKNTQGNEKNNTEGEG